jgi:hypothetical protein
LSTLLPGPAQSLQGGETRVQVWAHAGSGEREESVCVCGCVCVCGGGGGGGGPRDTTRDLYVDPGSRWDSFPHPSVAHGTGARPTARTSPRHRYSAHARAQATCRHIPSTHHDARGTVVPIWARPLLFTHGIVVNVCTHDVVQLAVADNRRNRSGRRGTVAAATMGGGDGGRSTGKTGTRAGLGRTTGAAMSGTQCPSPRTQAKPPLGKRPRAPSAWPVAWHGMGTALHHELPHTRTWAPRPPRGHTQRSRSSGHRPESRPPNSTP